MNLYDLIKLAKNNPYYMQLLVDQFQPLLKRYACFLDNEDGYADLQLIFIEAIHKYTPKTYPVEDMYILAYLKAVVKNAYISLSKKKQKDALLLFDDDIKLEQYSFDNYPYEFCNLIASLTELQKKVITLRYYHNYTDCEIANMLKISRQAVHRARKRATLSLRQILELN